MVVLGVYQSNWQRLWDLVQTDSQLYAAFGLHPVYLNDHRPEQVIELEQWLSRLAGHPQLCAVGEIGLDFLPELDRDDQQTLFEAQLQLAADFQLPALLHVRRSHAQVIATLKRLRLKRGGNVHGRQAVAKKPANISSWDSNWVWVSGTWPQALRLRKVIADLPPVAPVLGNDAPDMRSCTPTSATARSTCPYLALAEVMGISPGPSDW